MGTKLRSQWKGLQGEELLHQQCPWLWVGWPYEDPQPVMPQLLWFPRGMVEHLRWATHTDQCWPVQLSSADLVPHLAEVMQKYCKNVSALGWKEGLPITVDVLISRFAPLRKTTPPRNEERPEPSSFLPHSHLVNLEGCPSPEGRLALRILSSLPSRLYRLWRISLDLFSSELDGAVRTQWVSTRHLGKQDRGEKARHLQEAFKPELCDGGRGG